MSATKTGAEIVASLSKSWRLKDTQEIEINDHSYCHSCRRSVSEVPLKIHFACGKAIASDSVIMCEKCHELIAVVMNDMRRMVAFGNAQNMARIAVALNHLLKSKGEVEVIQMLSE